VVEGARLESDFGERHQATPRHLVEQSVQRFSPARYALPIFRKRRCSSPVLSPPYTVLTQISRSLADSGDVLLCPASSRGALASMNRFVLSRTTTGRLPPRLRGSPRGHGDALRVVPPRSTSSRTGDTVPWRRRLPSFFHSQYGNPSASARFWIASSRAGASVTQSATNCFEISHGPIFVYIVRTSRKLRCVRSLYTKSGHIYPRLELYARKGSKKQRSPGPNQLLSDWVESSSIWLGFDPRDTRG